MDAPNTVPPLPVRALAKKRIAAADMVSGLALAPRAIRANSAGPLQLPGALLERCSQSLVLLLDGYALSCDRQGLCVRGGAGSRGRGAEEGAVVSPGSRVTRAR